MKHVNQVLNRLTRDASARRDRRSHLSAVVRLGLVLVLCGMAGCAAMTNPVADGLPARRVPRELLAPSKAADQTIPLNLLRQPAPPDYLLGPGDVLGVYIEGFLGERNLQPPVHVGFQVLARDQRRLPASMGYPVPVLADGTIDLPVAGTLPVVGMTLTQARQAIRDLYARKELLKKDTAVVLVTLLQPRQYCVLVLRQEGAAFTTGPDGLIVGSKRGSGFEIDLPAYENDVLHALARTGGLPGLDACDEVIVYHGCFRDAPERALLWQNLKGVRTDLDPLQALGLGARVTHIPLRLPAGQPPCVRPGEVVLGTGDVVFIEARDDQLFYTGGLLPPAAHVLPRDHDLDVVEAVAMVRGTLVSGAFAVSNLSGALIQPGIGNPNPSLLTVLRRTPGGGQVAIKVDLDRALRHAEERLLVRAGDVLILQEQPEQALARYISQTFFNFDIFWQVFTSRTATGVIDASAPDRLPNRVGIVNTLPSGGS